MHIGTGLAKSGQTGHDNAGIDLLELFIAQVHLLHDAGPEIIQHHVGPAHQIPKDLLPFGRLQVEGQETLVAVIGGKVQTHLFVHGVVFTGDIPLPLPGEFHLDHIRPQVGQHLAGIGRGDELREFEDAKSLQTFFHQRFTSNICCMAAQRPVYWGSLFSKKACMPSFWSWPE